MTSRRILLFWGSNPATIRVHPLKHLDESRAVFAELPSAQRLLHLLLIERKYRKSGFEYPR